MQCTQLQFKPLNLAIIIGINTLSTQVMAAQKNVVDLGTTVVSGQKIDRTLQETVAGTSVLDEVSIEEASVTNLEEIIEQASNVNFIETGNYNSFAIRGINAIGVDGGGTDLSSILVNGAYLPVASFRGNLALWDMEQVVINKGPQSTTQGRNALAGTIILQTKDPEFDNNGSVKAGFGSHGAVNVAGMLNGKISDSFALRISAQHNEDDGEIENIYLKDKEHDFTDNTSVNVKLLYKASEKTSAKLALGYIDDSRGVRLTCNKVNSTDKYPCKSGDLKANQAIKPHHDFKTDFQTLEISHQLTPSWLIKSITSRTHIAEDDYDDWTRFNPESANYPKSGGKAMPESTGYNGWKRDTISQELRINYETNKVRTSTGLYGASNKTRRFRSGLSPFDFKDFLGALDTSGALSLDRGKEYLALDVSEDNGKFDVDTVALFNDTDFNITDKLTLNAGLRIEREKVSVHSKLLTKAAGDLTALDKALPNSVQYTQAKTSLANAACALNKQLCGASFTQIVGALNQQQLPGLNTIADDYLTNTVNKGADKPVDKETSTFLPKIGLRYAVDDNTTVGYLYSRGYRSGGAGVNTGTGVPYEYKPEFLDNHEVSLRTNMMNKRLNLAANAYYSDWKDQQVTVVGNANPYDSSTVNAGKSELYGLELESKYSHDSGVYGFANVALSKTKYNKFESNGVSYSGNEFERAPRTSGTVGLGYYNGQGLNGNVSTYMTEGGYQHPSNAIKSPSYSMTKVRIGYEGNDWRINGFVNNVFNKKVKENFYDFTIQAFAPITVFLPERSFGVNLQYDF